MIIALYMTEIFAKTTLFTQDTVDIRYFLPMFHKYPTRMLIYTYYNWQSLCNLCHWRMQLIIIGFANVNMCTIASIYIQYQVHGGAIDLPSIYIPDWVEAIDLFLEKCISEWYIKFQKTCTIGRLSLTYQYLEMWENSSHHDSVLSLQAQPFS